MKQVMGQKGLGPMTKLVRGFTLNSGWETWELMGEGEDEIRSWTGQPFNHSQRQRSIQQWQKYLPKGADTSVQE